MAWTLTWFHTWLAWFNIRNYQVSNWPSESGFSLSEWIRCHLRSWDVLITRIYLSLVLVSAWLTATLVARMIVPLSIWSFGNRVVTVHQRSGFHGTSRIMIPASYIPRTFAVADRNIQKALGKRGESLAMSCQVKRCIFSRPLRLTCSSNIPPWPFPFNRNHERGPNNVVGIGLRGVSCSKELCSSNWNNLGQKNVGTLW